jgi:hypothetical protein
LRLKFLLGKPEADPHHPSINGRYYDVRFRWDNLAFKGSDANM